MRLRYWSSTAYCFLRISLFGEHRGIICHFFQLYVSTIIMWIGRNPSVNLEVMNLSLKYMQVQRELTFFQVRCFFGILYIFHAISVFLDHYSLFFVKFSSRFVPWFHHRITLIFFWRFEQQESLIILLVYFVFIFLIYTGGWWSFIQCVSMFF